MENNKKLVNAIIYWIDEYNYETYSLSIGHGRNADARAVAAELANTWQDSQNWVRSGGGFVINQVDWPGTAASWLAQAKILSKDNPDAWVLISSAGSGLAVLKRLAGQKDWLAERTFVVFSTDELLKYAGDLVAYEGLKCITENGNKWLVSTNKFIQISLKMASIGLS
jgi:hypothetical protein